MLYRLLRKNLFIIIIGCGLLSIVGYKVLSNTRFSKNPEVMSSDSSSTKQQNINNDNGIRLNPKISPRRKGNIGSGHGHFIGRIPIPEISEEKRKRISALYDGNSWDKDPSWAKEGPPREEVDILVEGLNNLSAAKYLKALGGYGDYAREYADKALADNPNDFETLFIWTQLRSSNETVEKELGYRSLLEMDPNSIPALVGLGSIIKKDAPEEAIEHLEKANRLEPSEGLYELGWAYQRIGEYDKAIPMLEKAYGRYNHRWMLSEIESIKAGTPQIPLIQRESQEYQQNETVSNADKALLTEPIPPQSDGSIGIEAEIRTYFDHLTDSELAEFKKYFTDEVSTLLSKELIETPRLENFNARDFSPKQYDQAIETLKRYGPKEGLHRIRKGNPRLVQYIQHLLDGKSPQEK